MNLATAHWAHGILVHDQIAAGLAENIMAAGLQDHFPWVSPGTCSNHHPQAGHPAKQQAGADINSKLWLATHLPDDVTLSFVNIVLNARVPGLQVMHQSLQYPQPSPISMSVVCVKSDYQICIPGSITCPTMPPSIPVCIYTTCC